MFKPLFRFSNLCTGDLIDFNCHDQTFPNLSQRITWADKLGYRRTLFNSPFFSPNLGLFLLVTVSLDLSPEPCDLVNIGWAKNFCLFPSSFLSFTSIPYSLHFKSRTFHILSVFDGSVLELHVVQKSLKFFSAGWVNFHTIAFILPFFI